MKTTRFLFFVTIIVLLSVSMSGFSYNTTLRNDNLLPMSTTTKITPTTEEWQSPVIPIDENTDEVSEFIIFADDGNTYDSLETSLNIVRSYPNLKAFRVAMQISDVFELRKLYEFSFQPAQDFERIFMPVYETQKSTSLELNALEDAELMGVTGLWDLGYYGQGVTVGVFDNGVDFTHPALAGKKAFERNYNTDSRGTHPISFSHGTPVAGMIAAQGQTAEGINVTGTAPQAMIGAMNVGTYATVFFSGDLLTPWEWMAANNNSLQIVNTSWGGSATKWDPLVNSLEAAGILVVASAGNSGPSFQSVGGPGSAHSALAVGATTHTPSLATFSSRGYGTDLVIKPEVIAPGDSVVSTAVGGGYTVTSGTSFSSPATAGVAAVLISALEANGMTYNPGLLKAAIMRGADSVTGSERTEGKGMVNGLASWQYLQALQLDSNNMPKAVELTPRNGPVSYLETLPQDITTKLSISLITSHPGEVSLSITGAISNFISLGSIDPTHQSQVIPLNVDTTGVSKGIYTGNIVATLGNDEVITSYEIEIIDAPAHKGLIDVYHTPYNYHMGIGVGGGRTGDLIKSALTRGIWIEELNEPVTEQILADYDFFWMVRPSGFPGSEYSSEYPETEPGHHIVQSEIDAISNYVEGGGNLIMNLQGYFNEVFEGEIFETGTNINLYNPLLSNFGIEAVSEPIEVILSRNFQGSITSISTVSNVSSLAKGVSSIEHGGNYLTILDPTTTQILGTNQQDDDRITMATYTSSSGGRVLVSSSIQYFSNQFYTGSQSIQQNRQFSNNMIDWATSDLRINKISGSASDTQISGSYQLFDGNNPSSGATLRVIGNSLVEDQVITPTSQGNGVFSFSLPITSDGIYNIIAQFGSEYIQWSYIIDTTAPDVIPLDFPNQSVFEPGKFKLLKFNVSDAIDTLDKSNFHLTFEGEIVGINDFSYTTNTGELRYLIGSEIMVERDESYRLEIVVFDKFNNANIYLYEFTVGDVPETSISEPEPSSSSTEDGDFHLISVFISFIVIIPIFRRRLSKL